MRLEAGDHSERQPAGSQAAAWELRLVRFKGWKMKLQIEDLSGHHDSPMRYHTLEKLEKSEDDELRLYFNPVQFIAVPLFEDGHTTFTNTEGGGRFVSSDEGRELRYTVDFYL